MKCHDGTGQKCSKNAEFRLNDGKSDVPGACMCRNHALKALQEYHDKLGYDWIGIPIDIHGRKASAAHLHPQKG